MKATSRGRLDAIRRTYDGMLENMAAAGEAYEPFIVSLKEQATLMGQDLSAETIGSLRADMAPELNTQAKDLFTLVDKILQSEQQKEKELDDSLAAEASAEHSALDD